MQHHNFFTYLHYKDLEELARTNRINYKSIRHYMQLNWVRFLPHISAYSAIIKQLLPGNILIHHDDGVLITGSLQTGSSQIHTKDQELWSECRIIAAQSSCESCVIYVDSSQDLYQLTRNEKRLVTEQVKLISSSNQFAYLQCNDWLYSEKTLYKPPPSASAITCISFPWIGYEDGSIFNVVSRDMMNTESTVLCITEANKMVVSGHASGTIFISGKPIKIATSSAISALMAVDEFLLIGSADGVLHCYSIDSRCIQWSTRPLDTSPIMNITITSDCITVSTLSRVIKIHNPFIIH